MLSRQRKGHFIHPDVLKGRTPGGAAASSPWRRPPHRLVAAPVAAAQPAAQHRQGRGLAALPLSLPVRPVRQGAVSHGRLARMLPQGPGRAGHTPVGARPDRARRRDADPAGADQDPAQARRLGLGRRADHHRGCAARPLHGGRPADARGHGRGHRGARLPRRAQHLQQPHLPGHPAAGGRPGPAGHAAAPAGLPLRDAQPPVPHGRDHAAGPARGAAGDGRGARHHPHRGRLREREQLRRPAHPGTQEPGPQQPRDLRGQPVQEPGAGPARGLHRGGARADPRAARTAPAHDPPPRHLRAAHAGHVHLPGPLRGPAAAPGPGAEGAARGADGRHGRACARLPHHARARRRLVLGATARPHSCRSPGAARRSARRAHRARRCVLRPPGHARQLHAHGLPIHTRQRHRPGREGPGRCDP